MDQVILLYHGELLAGIEPPTPEFEHWLKPERQRLEDLAAKVVEQVAASDLPEATVKRALELGRQLIGQDRLREPVWPSLDEDACPPARQVGGDENLRQVP